MQSFRQGGIRLLNPPLALRKERRGDGYGERQLFLVARGLRHQTGLHPDAVRATSRVSIGKPGVRTTMWSQSRSVSSAHAVQHAMHTQFAPRHPDIEEAGTAG